MDCEYQIESLVDWFYLDDPTNRNKRAEFEELQRPVVYHIRAKISNSMYLADAYFDISANMSEEDLLFENTIEYGHRVFVRVLELRSEIEDALTYDVVFLSDPNNFYPTMSEVKKDLRALEKRYQEDIRVALNREETMRQRELSRS